MIVGRTLPRACRLAGQAARHRLDGEKASMARDYYIILGIRRDATEDEIKTAYRREAKKHHPDCSGEGSEPFLLIRDAYEVLSDPQRRRAHDQELARARSKGPHIAGTPGRQPAWAGRPPIEPLTPLRQAGYARDSDGRTSASSLLDALWGESHGPRRAEPGRGQEIHAEVLLTRRQALYGGRVRVWLPVSIVCPACRGQGWDGFFACYTCRGSGTLVDRRPLDVEFPGGVHDGAIGSVPLHQPGLGALSLVLHFRVDEW
ncbi:MAG: J domain-containing protein [Anaerolineae bacterium]|nr:J domain-containing protein [Anaerolineae bacterium]